MCAIILVYFNENLYIRTYWNRKVTALPFCGQYCKPMAIFVMKITL